MTARGVALALALALLSGAPAAAQTPLDSGSGPVQVDADNGIEWRREEKLYIASGNARAQRGETVVTADRLVARYREDADGKTTIYRLEAEGRGVVITNGADRVLGERAVYDVDRGVMTVVGRGLCLAAGSDVVTARDSLEYHQQRRLAFARGNAVATRGDRRVAAEELIAHLVEDPKTKTTKVAKVDAHRNVRVSSANEIAQGASGTYDIERNLATLVGDVRVTQGRNQLEGDYAEVDFNTGISRMLRGRAAGAASDRVRGLIFPATARDPSTPAAPRGAPPPPVPGRTCP